MLPHNYHLMSSWMGWISSLTMQVIVEVKTAMQLQKQESDRNCLGFTAVGKIYFFLSVIFYSHHSHTNINNYASSRWSLNIIQYSCCEIQWTTPHVPQFLVCIWEKKMVSITSRYEFVSGTKKVNLTKQHIPSSQSETMISKHWWWGFSWTGCWLAYFARTEVLTFNDIPCKLSSLLVNRHIPETLNNHRDINHIGHSIRLPIVKGL